MGIVAAGSQWNSSQSGTVPKFHFAMIAKFRYDSEISLSWRKVLCIAKISIFAMPVFFAMIANFCYHSEFSLS